MPTRNHAGPFHRCTTRFNVGVNVAARCAEIAVACEVSECIRIHVLLNFDLEFKIHQ